MSFLSCTLTCYLSFLCCTCDLSFLCCILTCSLHFLCCSLTWRRWRERVVTTASVSSWPQPTQCLISSTCVSWTSTRSPTKSVWQASSVLLVSISISLYTGSSKIVRTGLSAGKVIVRISVSFTWSLIAAIM